MAGPIKNEQAVADGSPGEGRPAAGGRCCGRIRDHGERLARRRASFMMVMPLLFLANLCALLMLIRKVNAVHREIAELGPRGYQAKGD